METTTYEDMLRGLQACNYSTMGALTFTFWDILITLEDEVREIWKKPWTKLKTLYLIIRFFSFGSQLFSAVFTIKLATGTVLTARGCSLLAGVQAISNQVLIMLVQVILILRVKALYYEHMFLRHLLHFLFVAEIATMSVIFALSLPGMQFGPQCVMVSLPVKALGFFIPPITFDLMLFVLTMAKFYQGLRDGWGREPIIARFMRDGIWVFFLPFTVLMINTCCLIVLKGAFSSVVYSWVIAIPGFAGYRLILNMSHLLKMNRHMPPGDSEQVLDTIPMTYETEFTNSFELRGYTADRTISSTTQL